jgi:hypothetical protein
MTGVTVTVARDGAIFGEFEEEAFEAAIRSRELLPTDDYWIEGMADWDTVQSYRARRAVAGSKVMAQTVKIEPPPKEAFAAPHVAIRTAVIPPARATWVRESGVALIVAAFAPCVWKPLIAVSAVMVVATLIVGVMATRRGSVRPGAMLVAGCALASLIGLAFFMLAPAVID